MEKILKIIIVFTLLMFLITRFVRTRKFREYTFSHTIPDTPPDIDEPEAYTSIISHEGLATINDPAAGITYQYHINGTLTIHKNLKELQKITVPPNAYYLTIDPIKEEIRLHHEGEIYIYTRPANT